MNYEKAATRIEDTVVMLARSGYLEPGTIRSLAHLGAGVALHDLNMRVLDRFGTQRSVSVLRVAQLIAEVQRELDEAKAGHDRTDTSKI